MPLAIAPFSAVGILHFASSKQPGKAKAKITSSIDMVMININTYRYAYRMKKVQVSAMPRKGIGYQTIKEWRVEIVTRVIISNAFSKRGTETLPPHRKYNP